MDTNTNTAAEAAVQTVARLVEQGMTPEAASAHVVNRMLTERPDLAVRVFAGLATTHRTAEA